MHSRSYHHSMSVDSWTRSSLTEQGFTGWVSWSECPTALKVIPREAGGVYVVVRHDVGAPTYLQRSPGGHFKGVDPTVPVEHLTANWVDEASVVYIGKANHSRLRERLEEYAKFGHGKPIGHRGGRLIWQLTDGQDLLVAWRVLPLDTTPLKEETRLITEFRASYGKPPFANDPNRLGR